jgi:hypothetical protein
MKIKPKADSPADLLGWMTEIVDVGKDSGAIPKTPIKTEFPKDSTDLTPSFKPPIRIAVFSGGRNDSSYELWRYDDVVELKGRKCHLRPFNDYCISKMKISQRILK